MMKLGGLVFPWAPTPQKLWHFDHFTNYYYIHLTAFFQDSLGKLAPER